MAIDFWTTLDGGKPNYYMVAQRHDFAREVTATTWEHMRTARQEVVQHACILHRAPYFIVDDGVRFVVPLYARRIFS